jgi:hypothetical protein
MKEILCKQNSSFPLPFPPTLLLGNSADKIASALLDESGVFPFSYHSTMVLHAHTRISSGG